MSGDTGRTPWGMGRVAFLANIEHFREQVSNGWPLTQIYQDHQQKLRGISYAQFTHYIRKYIRQSATKGGEGWGDATKASRSGVQPKRFQPGPKAPNAQDLV